MSKALSKIEWYVRRLQAMSPAEIAYRLHEAFKRKLDRRFGAARFVGPAVPFQTIPVLKAFRGGLGALQAHEGLVREWEDQTQAVQRRDFFFLGRQWPKSEGVCPWHLDPVSGRNWPDDRYCFAIDYRHAEGWGDIKLVWELNRLQHLQPIAALACLRRDEKLAAFCLSEIESWIDANPPFKGVNWCSGIELALRVVSMMVVVSLTADFMNPRQSAKIRQSIETHGHWLARYISAYSSANNHRTAEGLGLFVIGALCPELRKAAQWKKMGWDLLDEAARLQILPDGVGAEQTVSYTAVVLEMLLFGHSIASEAGQAESDLFRQRLVRGGEYLRWFTDGAGNLPHIGDNDNARVVGVYRLDETYIRSVLGCIAAVAGRGDLVPPCLQPHLRQALFGLPPAIAQGPLGVHRFEAGGYTVGRHMAGDDLFMIAMDHGPLGYLSIAAHGHADALAVWMHKNGQPVLIDAGTYLYHSGGAWRRYFRGTSAHNTLRVQHADSSHMAGNFNWSHKAQAQIVAFEENDARWSLEAMHDGYKRGFGVVHHRRLKVEPAAGFVVEDWLDGGVARFVEISFLFHPDLRLGIDGTDISVRKGTETVLRVRGEGALQARLYDATREDCGWYSETFGVKVPAPRLVFEGNLPAGQVFTTRFSF